MNKEDIEKAARIERENIHKELQEGYKKHKDINLYTAFSATVDKYAIQLFKAGANWRINSVWHEAKEKPETGKLVLFECRREYGKTYTVSFGENYKLMENVIIRWAYIEDLIPNKEG